MLNNYKASLERYLDELVPERPSELQKMEAYAAKHNFPIIGPASGQACYQIARLIKAQRIFELGSGYGYSTAWFARAVRENGGGSVHHVVWDDELSQMAQNHLQTLGYSDLVTFHVSEAVQTLRQADGPFDLIFNDIDKTAYPDSLAVIEQKLRPGGVLIIDNMVWSGRVWDETEQSDTTQAIRRATEMLTTSPNWISSLLPIRDGLLVAYKVG
ncbi:MAG: O-methyltransferase [Ardenticatenaceae bacterium]|nr:O-methyltransferase [Ardenticatenaceae bacterium]